MSSQCPNCNACNRPCPSNGRDRNSFLQLLLTSIIEALIVSVISSAINHIHHQHPHVEVTPGICILTEVEQSAEQR